MIVKDTVQSRVIHFWSKPVRYLAACLATSGLHIVHGIQKVFETAKSHKRAQAEVTSNLHSRQVLRDEEVRHRDILTVVLIASNGWDSILKP